MKTSSGCPVPWTWRQGPPRRLKSITSNLGAVTSIEYDTSARQQLAARQAGQPWRSTTSTAAVVVSAVHAAMTYR